MAYLQAIRIGIKYLYILYLVHNDITLSNIFSYRDSFIIRDFDLYTMEGNELRLKAGIKG